MQCIITKVGKDCKRTLLRWLAMGPICRAEGVDRETLRWTRLMQREQGIERSRRAVAVEGEDVREECYDW